MADACRSAIKERAFALEEAREPEAREERSLKVPTGCGELEYLLEGVDSPAEGRRSARRLVERSGVAIFTGSCAAISCATCFGLALCLDEL